MKGLNQETLNLIDDIVKRHQGRLGPVKLMLHDVQHEVGYIPFEAMEKISAACQVSVADVYGVVTFYSQFTTEPKGKHVVNICMGTACYVIGAQDLLEKILKMTDCEVNKTSKDGVFSVDATRCLGACGLAPVAVVDGKVYGQAGKTNQLELVIQEIIDQERAHVS